MSEQVDQANGRRTLNTILYVACVIAVCVVGLLAYLVVTDDGEATAHGRLAGGEIAVDGSGEDLHQRVLEAATQETQAFINVDHADFDTHRQSVLDGATGQFKKEFGETADKLEKITKRGELVMTGEVLSAGVVAANKDQATALVAVRTEVTGKETGGAAKERNLGFRLDLDYVDGAWLTSDLQEVWISR
ncbi:hypothetical protein [Nocardioides daejeonensis]|uniref:hypothetical protein n=1 Tax=Nocardioides daejeonensis TaxID=1046556 RepID=UPI000D7509B0|nr:hypothetical protein [Nocardioides daejeonensis]